MPRKPKKSKHMKEAWDATKWAGNTIIGGTAAQPAGTQNKHQEVTNKNRTAREEAQRAIREIEAPNKLKKRSLCQCERGDLATEQSGEGS